MQKSKDIKDRSSKRERSEEKDSGRAKESKYRDEKAYHRFEQRPTGKERDVEKRHKDKVALNKSKQEIVNESLI